MIFVFARNNKQSPPIWYSFFSLPSFLVCILWIFILANEVVAVLTTLGIMWNIDSIIMGLTFLAWANSIGDFVADTSLARIGKARTAVSSKFWLQTSSLNIIDIILLQMRSRFYRFFEWPKPTELRRSGIKKIVPL